MKVFSGTDIANVSTEDSTTTRGRVTLYLELHGYSSQGQQTDRRLVPSHEYEMFVTQNIKILDHKKGGVLGETNVHLIMCSNGGTNFVTNGKTN